MKLQLKFVLGVVVLLLGQACAQARLDSSSENSGPGGGASGGPSGSGGAISLGNLDVRPADTRRVPDRPGDVSPFGYDDAGNALCISILSLGQPAHYGNQAGTGDTTDAFQQFMNTYTQNANTGTTSTMTMLKKYTPLTDALLGQYNVVVLQALEDSEYNGLWNYTQSDVDALKRWVNDKGGAIIAMTGYGGNTSEVTPLNQLISFSGITYNTDDIFASCPDNMCYCAFSSIGFSGWQTNYTDFDQITHNLKKVGVFHGRSINCSGSDCQIFAKDSSGKNIGAAKVVGKGRVLAWADEWVTYTSQWGLTDSQYDTASNAQCNGYTPKTAYNVPQFWYNVFYWSVPAMQWCFTITVPPDADPGQIIVY